MIDTNTIYHHPQDLIELRHNQWVPRREETAPKTISQVHADALAKDIEEKFNLTVPAAPRSVFRMQKNVFYVRRRRRRSTLNIFQPMLNKMNTLRFFFDNCVFRAVPDYNQTPVLDGAKTTAEDRKKEAEGKEEKKEGGKKKGKKKKKTKATQPTAGATNSAVVA